MQINVFPIKEDWRVFSRIIYDRKQLIFLPCVAENIIVYNLDNHEFTKIEETWMLVKFSASNSIDYLESTVFIKYLPYESQSIISDEYKNYIKKKKEKYGKDWMAFI